MRRCTNRSCLWASCPTAACIATLPTARSRGSASRASGKRYREWVLSRQIDGCTITWEDNEHIRLATNTMFGKIIFHPRGDGPEVVEMRITRKTDGAPMFRVRFELTDELRAQELFLEMAEVLDRTDMRGMTRVLLCCAAGITTTIYENRMHALAEKLSLHYDFNAMPLDDAIARGSPLTSSWWHRRWATATRTPSAPSPTPRSSRFPATSLPALTCVPRWTSSSTPWRRASSRTPPADGADRASHRRHQGRHGRLGHPTASHSMVIGYRIFADRGVALDGTVYKRHVDFRDIEDVLATVKVDGIDVSALDAVGIALPGIINRESVSLPTDDIRDYDLGRELEKKYGIEVYMDNDANAAAMGCYMSQTDFDSVVFHIQRTGMWRAERASWSTGTWSRGATTMRAS